MLIFRTTLASLCLLFCSSLGAQSLPTSPIAGSEPSRPQAIRLDVMVKDKSGQPVHGLTAQDFTVLDNGKPQTLSNFTPVNTNDHPDAVQMLIVVDMINIGFDSIAWARDQIGNFLRQDAGKLGHPTSMAVMTDGGLRMMSGFTEDGTVLQSSFQQFGTDLRTVDRSAGWAGQDVMMEKSLQQFSQILAVEQARPGRKLLLFISPGWPMLPDQGSQEYLSAEQWVFNLDVRLTDSIHDARAAICVLDPFAMGTHDPFFYKSFLKPVSKLNQAEYPFLGLGVFAVHSGGRVLASGHDITGEINDAMHDAGSFYEITYDAPAPHAANEYHAISVRVNQPGVTVQTISGYYADPQNVGPEPKAKQPR